MARVPLRIGPLAPAGCFVQRSGLRWLCEEGQSCRAGQVIAYCNIGIASVDRPGQALDAFAAEMRDFQVAFILRVDGRVRMAPETSRGGFLDQLHHYQVWDSRYLIGEVECDGPVDAEPLRLMLAAGRRVTEHAEVRSGLLTGWHDRSRAWWGDGAAVAGTLLSLGSCEITAAIRGEHFDFTELLNASPGPVQVVLVPDDLLVPCARVVLEQVLRTPEQFAEIAADLAATLPLGAASSNPADWIFAGALLSALQRSPLTEGNHVLTRAGLQRIAGPDAVVMSLVAEPPRVFRHRRLGYTLCLHDYRIRDMSETLRTWLRNGFEPVLRDPDDIRRDYRELVDAVQRRSNMHFLVLNVMSSVGNEDILNYAQFDSPMGRTVGSVHNKEMNLTLHDLATERDVAIVDIDAIAADLGAAKHLPDGVHESGVMQAEVRKEILRILDDRRVPGFCAAVR